LAREVPDPPARGHPGAAAWRRAEHPYRAAGRADEVQQQPDRRGLAGPVGAEVAEDLAGGYLQREVLQPAVGAVELGEAVGLDDVGHTRSVTARGPARQGPWPDKLRPSRC